MPPAKRKKASKANVETASHVKAAQTRRAAERLLELGEAAEDEPMLDAAGAPARRHSRSFTPMWSQLRVLVSWQVLLPTLPPPLPQPSRRRRSLMLLMLLPVTLSRATLPWPPLLVRL